MCKRDAFTPRGRPLTTAADWRVRTLSLRPRPQGPREPPPPVPFQVEDQHPAPARAGEADEDVREGRHAQQPMVPPAPEGCRAKHEALAHGHRRVVVAAPPPDGPQAGPVFVFG